MKACNACHVKADTESDFCPLCGTPLEPASPPAGILPRNEYPDLSHVMVQYNFIRRLLLFISLLGCGLSVLVNVLVTPYFMWSLIVVASVAYCWLILPPLLRRGVNYAAQAVLQVVFTSVLVVALDVIIGYRGWSVTYVVPGLLCAGILAIALMIALNRTNWAQYLLYQLIMGIFGFVPLLLYFLGFARNMVMVLVTAGCALASLLATIVFGDRTIKSEFKRRFHF